VQGSGLGLAIAKGIAQAHKGEINASKRRGDFVLTIVLPVESKDNIFDIRKE